MLSAPFSLLPMVFALQQLAPTTPSSGDTVGYWQQRISYRIVARLDERVQAVHGVGELLYVNQSPDTLREMYFHQYLNAFRPGSRWSAVDEREGRERFQHLGEPDYAYERFTAVPTFNGTPVPPEYPLAPDSTVVRFGLPHPLAPGDSIRVHLEWDARPSARVYRRQGRRGRHYDFAQWYPKVAVYDRLGWEASPLVPAGELYGEFGTYDVTLEVPSDQVIGATGVPVSGDPGWSAVRAWGTVNLARGAYGEIPDDGAEPVPPGYRRVRFLAKGVHHFAWTAAPDYRYEGALYRGTIPVHVLYLPGDEGRWGRGRAVTMIVQALDWLERIYGPYAYPQVTGTHRLESGATEFPMLVMYGGLSPGLVLHETGHIYSYGLLANNEWRSGWMDEGLTDYQTAWAQGLTLPERARAARGERAAGGSGPERSGYRGLAVRPEPVDAQLLQQFRLDLLGRSEPIGTPGPAFSEFGIYNQMVYGRASMMYAALRDVLGDSAFVRFLHDYYARWQFKHVDERAMRGSAERVSGRDLEWFFRQWVHETGLIDYALREARTERAGAGWITRARIARVGAYRHPMPVGVLTTTEWVTARGDAMLDDQWVEIRSSERPRAVAIDPEHLTLEWDRRDDILPRDAVGRRGTARVVPDWPFLSQALAHRELVAVTPLVWYTDPGALTAALRLRTNYQGWLDRWEVGVAVPVRMPGSGVSGRLQGWLAVENPTVPFVARPLLGVSAGVWALDGVAKLELRKTWDRSPFYYANGPQRLWTLGVEATVPYDTAWLDPERWADVRVLDAHLAYRWRARATRGVAARAAVLGGLVDSTGGAARGFGRVEAEGSVVAPLGVRGVRGVTAMVRLFGGASDGAPRQRSIGLSALDPTETFGDHLLRGRGAPLARGDRHYLVPGGAGVRGYSPLLRMRNVAAANAQVTVALPAPRGSSWLPRAALAAFADGALGTLDRQGARSQAFADAGLGLSLHGTIFDRAFTARLDIPIWVRRAEGTLARGERLAWVVALGDLW